MVGPYRLRERLGTGGMGEVWDAWDERLGRRVAVKHVLEDDARRHRRLRREARALARLRHPAIVQVHDLVEAEDGDWIVMEHCPGQTLAERLRDGPLDPARVLSVGRDIAAGLAAAHQGGLLHRDLKSENVVLTPESARILDFGLVTTYWGPRQGRLTEDGDNVGTPRAMSPEQVEGSELDPRSDLFSFGVLLYELATGVSPFHATSAADTLMRVCRHRQPAAAELNPLVPAALSELIDGLLEKERARRRRHHTGPGVGSGATPGSSSSGARSCWGWRCSSATCRRARRWWWPSRRRRSVSAPGARRRCWPPRGCAPRCCAS